MKRYLLSLVVLCSVLTGFAAPYTSNEVPEDFTNDIMLNKDFVELKTGETYQITARRLPEIVECAFCDEVVLPKFTYTLLEGESVTIDKETGIITAVKAGRSLIEVGYKATTAFEKDYAAISPINMAYMVVEVSDTESDIAISTDITATSYDTYYYTTNTGFDLTFNVTAENATAVKVLLNGTAIDANADNSYTVCLANRTNVVEVEASNDKGTRRWAKTIDARRCEMTVKNITNPGMAITAGDSIHVAWRGMTMPVYKMLRFYNPTGDMFGEEATKVVYKNALLDSVKTNINPSQYDFASNDTIGMRLTESGEYIFKDGYIKTSWWGRALGDEKNFANGEYPETPGLADTQHGRFSKLPAFRINVAPKVDESTHTVTTIYAKDLKAAGGEDIVYDDNNAWDKTYSEDVQHSMLANSEIAAYHLPSGASYGGMSWEGFTLSKNFDSDFVTGSIEKQWGNSAGRGLMNADDPFLLSYFSHYCEYSITDKATHALQIDLTTEPRQILGAYVCPTAWTTNTVVIDGQFSRKFHAGDYLTITAHGLDAEGKDNGKTVVYYLADFRDAAAENHHIAQDWQWMDMSELGKVSGVYFTMESSDKSDSGPNTTCYFALDGLKTIRAKEDAQAEFYTVEASAQDAAMGEVSVAKMAGTEKDGKYMHGAKVKLAATPKEGYKFTKWSDNNTDSVRIITVTKDTVIVAHFEEDKKIETTTDNVKESALTVYTEGLTLYVVTDDSDSMMIVVDATGRTIYAGYDRTTTLPQNGIYIVRLGGVSTKVVVSNR